MTCDLCGGKGWVLRDRLAFADKCAACSGSGKLTWGRVAALLDEDEGTVRRVNRGRARVKTTQRVFEKLVEILGWQKQQKLFA